MRPIFAVGFALLLACSRGETQAVPEAPKRNAATQAERRFTDRSRSASDFTTLPMSQIPAAVDATYRVTPDRRFLEAAADVVELSTGRKASIVIDHGVKGWSVIIDGADRGTLEDIPTFAAATDWLTALAAASLPGSPLRSARVDSAAFHPPALFRAAGAAGEPSTLDAASAASLSHAATLVSVQTVDRFGFVDPLHARALALLAIARARNKGCCADDVAMLARAFGYQAEAEQSALKLAAGSFAHSYVMNAPAAGSDAAAKWLSVRNALHATNAATRKIVVEQLLPSSPASALPLFLEGANFDDSHAIGAAVAAFASADEAATTRATALQFAQQRNEFGRLLKNLESTSAARAESLSSEAFPARVISAQSNAQFHAGMARAFEFWLDELATEEGSDEFVCAIGEPRSAEAKQVRDWMQLRVDFEYGAAARTSALDAVRRIPLLSPDVRMHLVRHYEDVVGGHDPVLRRAIRETYPQLDSRPAEAIEAGSAATIIGDPSRRDLYAGSAVRRAPTLTEGSYLSWYAQMTSDVAQLRAIASSPRFRTTDRGAALSALAERPNPDFPFIFSKFEELASAGDDDVYPDMIDALNKAQDWPRKERFTKRALATTPPDDALTAAYYASSLADALERQGKYDEAWRVVQPRVDVFSANILSAAISLMQRRGDRKGATALAEKMIARYPDGRSRLDYAAILWRENEPQEAADILHPQNGYAMSDLSRHLTDVFLEAHGDRDKRASLAALAAVGIDARILASVVDAVAKSGKKDEAAALAMHLADLPDPAWNAHVTTWRALRDAKGIAAADAWLQPRVKRTSLLRFVIAAYALGENELVVQSALTQPGALTDHDVLTVAAAAIARLRAPAGDPRRVRITEAVAAQKMQPNSILPAAQYLLGLIDEASFVAWPRSPDDRNLASYSLGLTAALRNDVNRALPWLVAASHGKTTEPPAMWAIDLLWHWNGAKKPWPQVGDVWWGEGR